MLDRTQGEPPLEGMTRGEFLKVAGAAGLLVTCSGSVLAVLDGKAAAQVVGTGKYGPPFVEPVIYLCTTDPVGNNGTPVRTDQKCLPKDCGDGRGPRNWCKPAAGSLCLLPDGRLIYWNALEGTENSAAFIHDADHAL